MRREVEDEPTLYEAWRLLGERMGLDVEDRGERSVKVAGVVRGRPLSVEIDGTRARSEFARFFFGVNTISSRNRRERWSTRVAIGCSNPRGWTGVIESVVDTDDPAWNPRTYDPRNGRSIRSDPRALAAAALTADTHERLMSITADVRIDVRDRLIGIVHENTAIPGDGAQYVAGSLLHHPPPSGPPLPWPDRAIAGPPWWIDLLCDIADRLDR